MERYFRSIKEYIRKKLAINAREYLSNGLQLFHNVRKGTYSCIQPAIGNLAIAIELMLKTFITKVNPSLLFLNLPIELRAFFSSPKDIPQNFNWRVYDIDLKSFSYKTIDLNEAIGLLYIYFSQDKQMLKPYFTLLSCIRNLCIHASLPSYQKYDLEKIAYLALNVYDILNQANTFGIEAYRLSVKDKEFMKSYDEERIERVRKKIELAKQKSKKIKKEVDVCVVGDWDHFSTICPICDSMAILSGDTEFDVEIVGGPVEEPETEPVLTFIASSFECESCGLILDDVKELELAGIATTMDRSDDIDLWLEDFYKDYYEDYYEDY